jgi:hypothetical protein
VVDDLLQLRDPELLADLAQRGDLRRDAATLALTDVAPPFGTVPTTVTVFVTVLVPPHPAAAAANTAEASKSNADRRVIGRP